MFKEFKRTSHVLGDRCPSSAVQPWSNKLNTATSAEVDDEHVCMYRTIAKKARLDQFQAFKWNTSELATVHWQQSLGNKVTAVAFGL